MLHDKECTMQLGTHLVWMDKKWIVCECMLCIHCFMTIRCHFSRVTSVTCDDWHLGRIILVMIGATGVQ